MSHKLAVAEKFLSIQGEGISTGVPSIFIRLGGCNLLCAGAGWVCDTIEVWKNSIAVEFENIIEEKWIEGLRRGTHIIFTGGEPVQQQRQLIDFINWFEDKYKFSPYYEIETNGTIVMKDELFNKINQINCSPKLKNSGNSKKDRFKPDVIKQYASHKNSWFKFVVNGWNELKGIEEYIECGIDRKQVILMPAGESTEKLNRRRKTVAEMCIKENFKYSDRLQVVIWEQTTGV